MAVDRVLYSVRMGTCPSTGKNPFNPSFKEIKTIINIRDINDHHSALILWGGEDISPSIYDQPNIASDSGDVLSTRDQLELSFIDYAVQYNIPLIGICRGAQLLCAYAGGKLYQNVSGHFNNHVIELDDEFYFEGKKEMITSSLHHQMMYPWGCPHFMIAKTPERLSDVYERGDETLWVTPAYEPEIIWFPTIRGLAIQGHPEFMSRNSDFVRYCNYLTQRLINDNQCPFSFGS